MATERETHEFIEHNEKPNAGKLYRVPLSGNDELAYPFSLQA